MTDDKSQLKTVVTVKITKYDKGQIPGRDKPFEVEEIVLDENKAKKEMV